MKRCSTCNRTYTDPNLSFCIDDGTPLTPIASEDETTVVSPRDENGSKENDWNAPYQPPASYVPPGGPVPRKRAWPWILGTVGAFVLGILAISIAAAVLAPRWMRSAQNDPTRTTVGPDNANQSENSNVTAPENSNSNSGEDIDAPPPTDHDQVLAQLRDLENEWTVANLNADKKKLERILADDYLGQSNQGGLEGKVEYLETIQRNRNVEKWEFSDLQLMLTGDRATLSGNIRYVTQDGELIFDFKDKFVWRDGRWQATGSEVKQRK